MKQGSWAFRPLLQAAPRWGDGNSQVSGPLHGSSRSPGGLCRRPRWLQLEAEEQTLEGVPRTGRWEVGGGSQGTQQSPAESAQRLLSGPGHAAPPRQRSGEARGWPLAHTLPYSFRDCAGPAGSLPWVLGVPNCSAYRASGWPHPILFGT